MCLPCVIEGGARWNWRKLKVFVRKNDKFIMLLIMPEFQNITNRNCNALGIVAYRRLERKRVFYIGKCQLNMSGVAIVVDEFPPWVLTTNLSSLERINLIYSKSKVTLQFLLLNILFQYRRYKNKYFS